ncbi:MAG: zinc transport system substrate-binding protein [Actinomycetota bacterium]|nr:zinc transport system substrate-binding protein [Actinomycetota bacterium]
MLRPVHDAGMPRTTIAVVVALGLAAAGCGRTDPSVRAEQRGKPVIVTALRPLAEAAERVGGDSVVVVDLTPVGRSPHRLTITPRERKEIIGANLAIVVGKGFQRDVEQAAAQRRGATLDVLASLRLPDRPDHAAGPVDPHVWLDPTIMGSIVTAIGEHVAALVPAQAAAIRARAHRIVEDDVRLDATIEQGLRSCARRGIASQHESFGWFAARYRLTSMGFDAPEPDADPAPDAARLAAITPRLSDGSITTLFTEPLTPTGWLEVLAEKHGLGVAVLDPYEGLTQEEESKRTTYRSVLLDDLRVLQDGLDCQAA